MRFLTALITVAVTLVAAPSSSAVERSSLTASASQARNQVTSLVREYEAQYGPRVSVAERAQLRGMVREARSEMNSLVRLVRKAERTNRLSDWRRAYSHYVAIRATADNRLAQVRDILGSEMTFTEQLGAWSQARSALQDLDSLGSQLERRAR
jgi:hypothetical protein